MGTIAALMTASSLAAEADECEGTSTAIELCGWLAPMAPWVFYLVVWGLVFVGTALFVGVFLPFVTGDTLLFVAGALAATIPSASIWALAIGVGIAAFLSDQLGYVLGRHFGRPYLERRTSPFIRKAIARTDRFYELFGWWSVVVARYVPVIRALLPPVAGIGGMPYWRFLSANVVGALGWGVLITVAGYLTVYFEWARPAAYAIGGAAIIASVVAGIRAVVLDRRARRGAEGGVAGRE